uniref:Uncharacterized protein n=1 Tax=viral metagenome TaxID=1070528 RepID=A0A6M3JM06_9ZZZZ
MLEIKEWMPELGMVVIYKPTGKYMRIVKFDGDNILVTTASVGKFAMQFWARKEELKPIL